MGKIIMSKEENLKLTGIVVSEQGKGKFLIKLDEGIEVEAYICGKMRKSFIKILVGDKVDVEISPYDVHRGRIVWRYK